MLEKLPTTDRPATGYSIRRHTSRHLTPKLLFPWHVKVKKARTGTQAVDKGNTFARVAHSVKPWLPPWFLCENNFPDPYQKKKKKEELSDPVTHC